MKLVSSYKNNYYKNLYNIFPPLTTVSLTSPPKTSLYNPIAASKSGTAMATWFKRPNRQELKGIAVKGVGVVENNLSLNYMDTGK